MPIVRRFDVEMTDMTDLHTRRFTRVRLRCSIEIQVKQGGRRARWDGHITKVSERGGFVEVDGDQAVGTHLMLRFGFPLTNDLICIGVARYLEPGVGVGVEFIGLSDLDHACIVGLMQGGGTECGDG